jgi:hypothetical protein
MRFAIRFAAVVIAAGMFTSLHAQTYPFPGRNTSPPVLCTTCPLPNKNLPTAAYTAPLSFVGRYVDSQTTRAIQNLGMRTVRARKIRVAPTPIGRVYIGLGDAVGNYRLDRFFTTNLTAPMVPCSVMGTGHSFTGRSPGPLEKIVKPDSFFYAEAGQSGWDAKTIDTTSVVSDFDVDDRGFLYVGTKVYGWGIARDRGVAGHMEFVAQNKDDSIVADSVISLKTGGKYFVVLSDGTKAGAAAFIRDVTAPATPGIPLVRRGPAHGIIFWTKFDRDARLAVLSADGKVRVYDYAAYVTTGTARETLALLPATQKKFTDLSFDENGTLWVTESGAAGTFANLWRVSPNATAPTGYVATPLDTYGSAFSPEMIAVGGGFIAVAGRQKVGNANDMDVRLFRVGTGIPTAVDTGGFFRNYYYKALTGFAAPLANMGQQDLAIITQGGKRYLLHSALGLGDVYEITGS